MNWKVAEAKQRFSEVVRVAEEEPQMIYNRGKLVAAVVPAEEIQEFLTWREGREHSSLGDAFAALRKICAEEDYSFEIPPRRIAATAQLQGLTLVTRNSRDFEDCGIPLLNPFV